MQSVVANHAFELIRAQLVRVQHLGATRLMTDVPGELCAPRALSA
jgi:hypothetical protein